MPWTDAPDEALRPPASAVTLAVVSICLACAAMCFPLLIVPPIILAWCAWWRCRTNASTPGFGTTIMALVFSHIVLVVWMLLLGALARGTLGVQVMLVALCVYALLCTMLVQSMAWKYLLFGMAVGVIGLSLLGSSIVATRARSTTNEAMDNLRMLGISMHQAERSRSDASRD